MKIVVIGAGAMGSIYGGRLSERHEVCLVDTNAALVEKINREGLSIEENGAQSLYHPSALTSTEGIGKADLVILFVKALFSRTALDHNRSVIGPRTYVMTLQNGSGHEDMISEFVPQNRIIIGTTEDNGAVLEPGRIRRGGRGVTNVGMPSGDPERFLTRVKEAFDSCGFTTVIHDDIQRLIWDKLFTNVSLSVLTGVLQAPMGHIAGNPHAWKIAVQLIREAVAVAAGLGLEFDESQVLQKVKSTSLSSPEGRTSICADLSQGRRTEVDTISGSVVKASKKCGVPAPTHELMVELVHAMEERPKE